MAIHIGNMIRERLRMKGQTVVWFSKQINRSHSTCYNIFESDDIDIMLLKKICKVLEYNFFKDLSSEIDSSLSKK